MPRLYIYLVSLSLLFGASPVLAQDDYDFDTPVEEGDGGGEDDFVFDTPVGPGDTPVEAPASDTAGGGGSLDFLGDGGGDADSFDQVERKPLTAAEAEALRLAENQRIWVLQRRPFLKTGRFEMAPMFSYNVNDPLIDYATFASDFNYYLNEQMAIGLRGSYSLNAETGSFDRLVQDYSVFPKITRPIWSASAHFQYTPLYGKLAAFGSWILPWELYARGGAGYLQTFIAGHVFVTAGGGQRFFLNRWLTFNVDIDYQIFQERFSETESVLVSNLVFGVGLGIYMPFDFEYRELR